MSIIYLPRIRAIVSLPMRPLDKSIIWSTHVHGVKAFLFDMGDNWQVVLINIVLTYEANIFACSRRLVHCLPWALFHILPSLFLPSFIFYVISSFSVLLLIFFSYMFIFPFHLHFFIRASFFGPTFILLSYIHFLCWHTMIVLTTFAQHNTYSRRTFLFPCNLSRVKNCCSTYSLSNFAQLSRCKHLWHT